MEIGPPAPMNTAKIPLPLLIKLQRITKLLALRCIVIAPHLTYGAYAYIKFAKI